MENTKGSPTDLLRPSIADPYYTLAAVLHHALMQASHGKGAERHANGQSFEDQPMLQISRMLRTPAGCLYQVMKKSQEAQGMLNNGNPEAAKREILGAINYLAGAYMIIDEV